MTSIILTITVQQFHWMYRLIHFSIYWTVLFYILLALKQINMNIIWFAFCIRSSIKFNILSKCYKHYVISNFMHLLRYQFYNWNLLIFIKFIHNCFKNTCQITICRRQFHHCLKRFLCFSANNRTLLKCNIHYQHFCNQSNIANI